MPTAVSSIAVWSDDPRLRPCAEEIGSRLGLPLGDDAPVLLRVTPERLELVQTGEGAPGPVWIDLGAVDTRSAGGARRDQPLSRAVGLRQGVRRVVDATAGLLHDAFLLASMGCEVVCVERSGVLHEMQRDALERGASDPALAAACARMTLVRADAREWLGGLGAAARPEAVYLDPMHPARRKSALVKKEMRLLRLLVGEDADAQELLAAAIGAATRRVVVKRPGHAPALAEGVVGSHKGRAVRYDVYSGRGGDV
ncbi:MAG: rRNA methyltransferase [Phycisphaerales bacterium]|nr:MAG: rRNA methyltransferase [Phycisphaerales bacterium]